MPGSGERRWDQSPQTDYHGPTDLNQEAIVNYSLVSQLQVCISDLIAVPDSEGENVLRGEESQPPSEQDVAKCKTRHLTEQRTSTLVGT